MLNKFMAERAIKKGRYGAKPVAIVDSKEYTDGIERLLSATEKYHYARHTHTFLFESSADREELAELRYFDPLNIRKHYERFQPDPLNIGSIDDPRIYALHKDGVDTKVRLTNLSQGSADIFDLEAGAYWQGSNIQLNASTPLDFFYLVLTRKEPWVSIDYNPLPLRLAITGRYHPNPDPFKDLSGDLSRYRHEFSEKAEAAWLIRSSLADVMWVRQQELVAFKAWAAQYPDIEREAQELDRQNLVTSRLPELMIEAELFLLETVSSEFWNKLAYTHRQEIDRRLNEIRPLNSEARIGFGKERYGFFESHLVPSCSPAVAID